MSTNQTGHEQNVFSLGVVLDRIATYHQNYNPPRDELSITSLMQLKNMGENAIALVTSVENVYRKANIERTMAFDALDSLITRVIFELRNSGASSLIIAQAEAIVRDLRGKRGSGKSSQKEGSLAGESGIETKIVTLYKGSIDSRIENFNKLVRLLSIVDAYRPNETELSVTGLNAKLMELKTLHNTLIASDAALDSARWKRNAILYQPGTGLVDRALAVQIYVKSVFGAMSLKYKEISSVVFSKAR